MAISDAIKKLESLMKFDEVKIIDDILTENSDKVKALLLNQLSTGTDGKGNRVTIFGREGYSERTIYRKLNEEGLSPLAREIRFITNYMSGNFYQSIKLKVEGRQFIFTSDLDYYDDIIQRSGDDIMVLDEDNLKNLSQTIVAPELSKRLKQLADGL